MIPDRLRWSVSNDRRTAAGQPPVAAMNAIKAALKLIADTPTSEEAKTLARLVVALESDEVFDLGRLYALNQRAFYLALDVLEDWRVGRHSAGMAKLFDLSCQVNRKSLS